MKVDKIETGKLKTSKSRKKQEKCQIKGYNNVP